MPRTPSTQQSSNWAAVFRRAPAGVLVLSGMLLFLGAGLIVSGTYLAITRPSVGWLAGLSAVALGPLVIYVALHVVRLTHWAWLVLVLVMVMLFLSSCVRLLASPELTAAPVAELLAEIAALVYLARKPVRDVFRND